MKSLSDIEQISYAQSINEIDPRYPNILITQSQTRMEDIPSVLLENTKLIIHPNSGYDNFSEDFFHQSKIPIKIGPIIRTQAVCEYILSCLFHWNTSIPFKKSWDPKRAFKRKLLKNQKGLLLGWGNIGQLVETNLNTLNVELDIIDPFKNKSCTLKSQYDFILICANLHNQNKNLVNSDIINLLDPNGAIINSARGELLDLESLLKFLHKNPKAYAYLDVFPKSPFDFSLFNSFENVFTSSHIAGVYDGIEENILSFIKKSLIEFINENEF